MIQISLGSLSAVVSLITEFESKLSILSKFSPTTLLREINQEKLDIETIKMLLNETLRAVDEIGLDGTKRFTNFILADLESINVIKLSNDLKRLEQILESELAEQWVMYIPKDNARWFENSKSFGRSVMIDSFPSALGDILEAGNCYALDRPTACVFHCMRILEHGLKVLAQELNVSFDLTNWKNVIDQIESEIKKLRNTPKTSEKDEKLQFFSEAAKEFMYFKDGWRNHVSHRRTFYDMSQAYSVLSHVRAFMQHLSKQLKEVP